MTSQLFNAPLLFNASNEGYPKDICSVFDLCELESPGYNPLLIA